MPGENRIPAWVWWLSGIILALMLLVTLLVTLALRSDSFNRFIVNRVQQQVDGLEITHLTGDLGSGLGFDFRYRSEPVTIAADSVRVTINARCLWWKTLCIETLRMAALDINLLSSEPEAPDEPVELPAISLPVAIRIDSLNITALSLSRDDELLHPLESVDTKLDFQGSQLTLTDLTARDRYCRWQLNGSIHFQNHYPIDSRVTCSSGALPGEFQARVDGDLQTLVADVQSQLSLEPLTAPLKTRARVQIGLLDPQLPLEASAELLQPTGYAVENRQWQFAEASIAVSGPALAPGFDGELALAGDYVPAGSRASITGNTDYQTVHLDALTLLLPEGTVELTGDLLLQSPLRWQGALNWQGIDVQQWESPVAAVVSGQSQLTLEMTEQNLQAELALEQLSGTLEDRPVTGSGHFVLNNNQLTIDNFNLQQDRNHTSLSGVIDNETVNLTQTLDIQELAWLLPGSSREPSPESGPQRSGSLSGTVRVSGELNDPLFEANLRGDNLRRDNQSVQRVTLAVNWRRRASSQSNRVDLSAFGITGPERLSDTLGPVNLEASWRGAMDDHRINVMLANQDDEQPITAALHCGGRFTGAEAVLQSWSARCDTLSLDYFWKQNGQPLEHQWRLDNPVELAVELEPLSVMVSGFCLRGQGASVCSDETVHYHDDGLEKIAIRGDGLPIDWLKPWMPEDVNITGEWYFQLSGETLLSNTPSDHPQLRAGIYTDGARAQWLNHQRERNQQQPLTLDFSSRADWQWEDNRHRLVWQLDAADTGRIEGQLTAQDQQLNGELIIEQLILEKMSGAFVDMDRNQVAGNLDGRLQLSGTLEQPLVNGQINLRQGYLAGDLVPVPVKDIEVDIQVAGDRAQADGTFFVGDQSGELGGSFYWHPDDWLAQLHLKANNVVVRPAQEITIHVSPDVNLRISPRDIALTGTVAVPRARMRVRSLPEQAVSESSDSVIVGQEDTGPGNQRITTDLHVVLGDDVRFEGFGLETRITGNLDITQTNGNLLRGNGILSLQDGRYKAYGQNLKIEEGDLIFVDLIDNPQLRLSAIRDSIEANIIVGLRASGPARQPTIELFSRPEMSQQEKLSYLLTGNPPGTQTEVDPKLAAAEAALNYALDTGTGTSITQSAGEFLGIEDLRVSTSSSDSGSYVGVSGYIAPDLLVRYGVGVFDAVNSITLNYKIRKNLYLEMISADASVLDLLWTFEIE